MQQQRARPRGGRPDPVRVRRRARVGVAAVLLALGARPASLRAQLPMIGRVTTEAGVPIEGAEVRLDGQRARHRTDSAGFFRIPDVGNGLVSFGVRRLGFLPVAELLRVRAGDTLEVTLEPLGVALDTVKVVAELEEEWERALRRYGLMLQEARLGSVITANDIANRQPQWLSDMLYGQVGFTVIGNGTGAQVLGRSRCRPNIYVDGMLAMGFNLNNMQPGAVRLMVLYRNFTALPSQLQVPFADRSCGGIVLNTMR
jgi:hypothetical protein